MTAKGFHVTKLIDSLYADQILNIDDEAIYCEIQYQRDKSSFAGIAMKVTNEKDLFIVKKHTEAIFQEIGKYEKLYIGCDQDYIDAMKRVFSLEKREYGIEVLFLVYSDVRSSQIIFEELMRNVDKCTFRQSS